MDVSLFHFVFQGTLLQERDATQKVACLHVTFQNVDVCEDITTSPTPANDAEAEAETGEAEPDEIKQMEKSITFVGEMG
jgi:hypothetical protein